MPEHSIEFPWQQAFDAAIPIAGPWITDLEVEYVAEAVRTAWYDKARTYLTRFEDAFATSVGRQYALSLPSCTSGLHLILAALDLKPGDEVIVPEATWIASAAPVTYFGADLVFADVDPETWCIDANSVKDHITSRTKAIIAVDLYGGTPDMTGLQDLADAHSIPLIEDAAEAIGSRRNGRVAGSFGLASVFSFHGTKTLTTGEGGMLVTDDAPLFERVRYLSDHARHPQDDEFFQDEVAFKYKMSSLQAALGLAQLERLPDLIEKKRTIFTWYHELLADSRDHIRLNYEPAGSFNTFWMVTAIIAPEVGVSGKLVRKALGDRNINTRPFFHPLSSLPALRHMPHAATAKLQNQTAYHLAEYGLNLPSALLLSQNDVARVVESIHAVLPSA